MIRQAVASGDRYLDREERYELARLRDQGMTIRAVAARLGRAPSTISRELRRHDGSLWPGRKHQGYQPERAHQWALRDRARPKTRRLTRHPQLRALVQERLDQRDSPEQISGRLRREFPDDKEMQLSHEAIYQAIYVLPRGDLRRQLRAHLRTGRSNRQRRNQRQHRGAIPNPVSIHDRPAEIEQRLVPGHYEGDLLCGPQGTPTAFGTLVERRSGHLSVFRTDKTTETTVARLTETVQHASWPVLSLTWDRGSEMARHAQFTDTTKVQVYFADPHAPWQRGSNENTNGLLREYFPKGHDLGGYTDTDIQTAVDQLNNRPRKRHGYRTPNEVMTDIINGEAGVATLT